jgi:threonine dehydrogenase-like Zn-dependent dehydrogenase
MEDAAKLADSRTLRYCGTTALLNGGRASAEYQARKSFKAFWDGEKLLYAHVHLQGFPAPVRRFLPELIDLVWKGKINPNKVFDLTLPLDQVAEGCRAMDQRRAIKTLLRP